MPVQHSAAMLRNKCMNETTLGEVLFYGVEHGEGFVTSQLVVRVDRLDLMGKTIHFLIPTPVLFHKYVDSVVTRWASSQNQRVALRSPLLWRFGFVENLNHVLNSAPGGEAASEHTR